MKKSTKFFSLIIGALFVLFSAILLSGCYTVKSGKLNDIIGTYELTAYSKDVDLIEQNEITCYLILREDETGYYVYKDKDTPLFYSEIKCRFLPDEENEGHYNYVEVESTNTNEWDKLGVNMLSKILNSKKPKYKGNLIDGNLAVDYYITVKLRKVDSATDISYVQETLKTDIPFFPYGEVPTE